MINHDQNQVNPETKIDGDDKMSQNKEVEAVLENVDEPKVEENVVESETAAEEAETALPEEEAASVETETIDIEEPALEQAEAAEVEEPKAEEAEVEAEETETPAETEEVEEVEAAAEEATEAEEAVAETDTDAKEEAPEGEVDEAKVELTQEEIEHEKMLSMYEDSFSNFKVGEIIEGNVVDVSDKDVRVDIGYKHEGVIPISEFAYSGIPDKDSTIKVYISKIDGGDGRVVLSKKRADYHENIQRIKDAFADGGILDGTIRRRVKGGMIAEVMGIEGFLPGSQMSLKPIPNLDQFINKDMQFKVINMDEEKGNIIFSRRAVLEEEAAKKREELLKKIEIDSELEGEVKNITQYGAFIDLGGIDGLLHLTDMSWGKLGHPSEMLDIGDKVKVKVINFDSETHKISLGLKQLVPHPWENIEIKYPEGTRISGKVVSVKSFGAFVELEPGVDGLVHISEMSWTKRISDARKILKTGDNINAIVLELDKENKRISLGMRQMDPNPWLTIEDRYPVGTVLKRKVKSLTAFGAFVEIEEGIDGLVHISDISWTKRIYHPREAFRKGQEIETIILSIDTAQRRIALGVKQLAPDPWETLNVNLPVNTEVFGTISKLIPKGVLVDIAVNEDLVEGFIPISHLVLPKLEHSEDAFQVGEELPLKVIELDMDNRRLILSVKAFFFSRDPKLQEDFITIHEQYMRDRVVELQKKKAQKLQREKLAAERKAKAEAEAKAKAEEKARLKKEAAEKKAAEEAEAAAKAAEEAPVEEAETPEVKAEEPAEAEAKVEEPKAEEAVAEEAETPEVKAEEPAEEEAKAEEPVAEKTVAEEPAEETEETPETASEEAVIEEPVAEEPAAEEPETPEAVVEEPAAEEPKAEEATEATETTETVETPEVATEEPAVEETEDKENEETEASTELE